IEAPMFYRGPQDSAGLGCPAPSHNLKVRERRPVTELTVLDEFLEDITSLFTSRLDLVPPTLSAQPARIAPNDFKNGKLLSLIDCFQRDHFSLPPRVRVWQRTRSDASRYAGLFTYLGRRNSG